MTKRWLVLLVVITLAASLAACTAPSPSTSAPAAKPTTTPAASTTPTPAPTVKTTPAPAASPAAQSAADFFASRNVHLINAQSIGGGVDYAARTFSAYWPDITGGVMVVDYKPGAGGEVGVTFVYNAEPDGRTLLCVVYATVMGPALFPGPTVPQYDVTKMSWFGGGMDEPYSLAIGAKEKISTLDELKAAKGLKYGGSGPTGATSIWGSTTSALLGLDSSLVTGFSGTVDNFLAVGRGELNFIVSHGATLSDGVKRGQIKPPILTIDRVRSPYFPDLPAITEIVKLTPEQDKWLTLTLSLRQMKAFGGPPGIPADRLKFLRDKFMEEMKNPGFLSQAKLRWEFWVPPITGEELTKQIQAVLAMKGPDTEAFYNKVLKPRTR